MKTDVNSSIADLENISIKLQQIIAMIQKQSGYDFSCYKRNNMIRSIQKRMEKIQIDTLSAYIHYIHQHSTELPILIKSLLIHITHFFRDEAAFELLKNELLAKISKSSFVNNCFRVWIPGCSSGEEAYSVAILLHECINYLGVDLKVRIFATDISEDMIEIAREGVFPSSIEENVNAERLQNFFIKTQGGYEIKPQIRKMIVFSVHNLIEELPFTKLDLLCCRNLLIYLKLSAQKKIISLFNNSLHSNGLLMLGSSENIGDSIDVFNTLDNKWRLYERKNIELITEESINSSCSPSSRSHDLFAGSNDFRPKQDPWIPRMIQRTSRGSGMTWAGQAKIEGLEASIEEIKSINEELQALYEASQAMNEELQSLNETLSTNNLELQNYIEYLFNAKIEMSNLLNNIDTATLFLDRNLCIKHFTPNTTEIINLIPADVGRPVNHISSNMHYQDLTEDAQTVLKTQESMETECLDKQGNSYLIKIMPYRSTNIMVEGVVITFLKIQAAKQAKNN